MFRVTRNIAVIYNITVGFFTCRVQFGIAFAISYTIVLKNAAI
jgi:hypothetical protein